MLIEEREKVRGEGAGVGLLEPRERERARHEDTGGGGRRSYRLMWVEGPAVVSWISEFVAR